MALQTQRNNGVRKFDSTYYSRTNFINYKENTRVNVTYSSGMIKLTIATAQGTSDNGMSNWEDQITVSITGTKAHLLLNALAEYEKAIEENTITLSQSWGIATGMTEIQTILMFHLNKVNSTKAFSICSIDAAGTVLKRFTYNFPDDQDFHIDWSNFDSMKNDRVCDVDLQYKMLKETIAEFARTSNGAAGYTAVDLARYDINAIRNNITAIGENLGVIQPRQGGNFNRNTSGGYFNNNNNQGGNNAGGNRTNSNSQHRSLDEIQSEFNLDDDEE